MKKTQSFNLEKIKELTSSIDDLQGKINQLNEISEKLKNSKLNLTFPDTQNSLELENMFKTLNKININLTEITNENIKSFLDFRNSLIKRYKESYKDKLKSLKLQKGDTHLIGLFLIENKKISKILDKTSYTLAIDLVKWVELFDSLKQNTIFSSIIIKLNAFYNKILQKKLETQLRNLPNSIDPLLKDQFKEKFYRNPELTFEKFLKSLENQASHEEIKNKKEILKKIKEMEEIEKLKKEQEERKELYEDYLKLSHKEFERKLRKGKRQTLKKPKSTKKTEDIKLSDEVTEKIEKFKSQFAESFQEKYLIMKDNESDPLEIIRKRKKKKEKEYKEFKNHFDKID
ncbi:MAG: hypothetical protein ACFFD5_09920 [Candidatus Thorarchaeota archaeon]